MCLFDVFLSEQMVNEVLKNKRSIEGKVSPFHMVCFRACVSDDELLTASHALSCPLFVHVCLCVFRQSSVSLVER